MYLNSHSYKRDNKCREVMSR